MEALMDSPTPKDARTRAGKRKRGRNRSQKRSRSLMPLFQDIAASFRAPGFWLYGAWIDTSLRYRSQALGAFWMVAATLTFVLVLGSLYSRVFSHDNPVYFGHLATGYVFWIFMQQLLVKSSRLFSSYKSMIQNGYVKYADYELRGFVGQLINLAYNLLVVVGVMVATQIVPTTAALMLFFTVPLLLITMLGASFFLSVLGARYPDFGELLQSVLRLGFFVTPIIWSVGSVGKATMIGPFIYLNPFYYLIEVVRGPLIYAIVPWFEIGVTAAMAVIIWALAAVVYARAKPYIPLWV
jgi:homopolymeric O-antigen transport system permease protein